MEITLKVVAYNLVFWSLLGTILFRAMRSLQKGVAYVKELHQIPCARCIFFTRQYCLKCTVHPKTALTIDAIGCRDFHPTVSSQKE